MTILEEQTDGIFAGKSFVILGFPPEQEEQILDMLITNGGNCLFRALLIFFFKGSFKLGSVHARFSCA